MSSALTHYRHSSLGVALHEALQEMLDADEISPNNAMLILEQFDISINAELPKEDKVTASFKGHLNTYRNLDGVWTWVLDDVTLSVDGDTIPVDRLKVVACDGRPPK